MKTNAKTSGMCALARRLVIAATLALACPAVGAVASFAADEFAIWHFKITVNSSISGDAVTPEAPAISASASAEETLSPLVLEFEVNQNVEPMRDTLKASYTWSSRQKQIFEGLLLFKSEGFGQGSSLEDWEVVLTRHFNPIDCDSFFFVDDEWERDFAPDFPRFTYTPPTPDGSAQDPAAIHLWRKMQIAEKQKEGDKLDFRIRADFPVTVTSHNYDSGETVTDTWTNSFQDSGKVNYDYRIATQSVRPEPVSGVYGTGVILPEINLSRHTIDLDIARKPVKLTLSASPGKGKGSTIRFNNKILVDGVDRSKLFKVHRLERDWFLMGDPLDPSTYHDFEVVNDWHDVTDDGNLAAEREVSFDSFFPPKSPRSAWGDRLYIAEFLDTVERLPEFGFLYHVVLMQTEEGSKTVLIDAFASEEVGTDKWCELFSREEFLPADIPLKKVLTTKNFP